MRRSVIADIWGCRNSRGGRSASSGFTIVETLIVLAVTGVLFVSIAGVIEGKRQKTEFKQSTNAIKSQIEQIINETQSGYFPSGAKFSCKAPSDSSGKLVFPGAAASQGTNNECMFLGKVIQFSKAYGDDPEVYATYIVAGRRQTEAKKNVTSFDDSTPTVVDPGNPSESVTNKTSLQYGLKLKWAQYQTKDDIGAVGFFSYFGDDQGLARGSSTTQVVPILNTPRTVANEAKVIKNIDENMVSSFANKNPASGVKLCFTDGDRSALITVGRGQGANAVDMQIKNGDDC